jgi:quinone-modifying oxidoreductase subunit QmoC
MPAGIPVAPEHESSLATAAAARQNPVPIEPDVDFIRVLCKQSNNYVKLCMQCGACSVTCGITPDRAPFPRKEMVWTAWGLKDRLLSDPDIWLCHQCNDCSIRCPRGAHPGDVLAAVRQEIIAHYSAPRFLARWMREPKYLPLLLAIPAFLLGLALLLKDSISGILGLSTELPNRIVFSYSSFFPQWLLNGFFFLFTIIAFLAAIVGVVRFWRSMSAAGARDGYQLWKAPRTVVLSVIKKVFTHDNFTLCTTSHARFLPHFSVFFGFAALLMVTFWVITNKYNPLIRGDFVYPFDFWNPLKMLANLGGLAVLGGCLLMIRDRLISRDGMTSTYSDWFLVSTLLAVVGTGFITELLHYARLVPHRHVAYFIHLVCVFALIVYLPYSKLAHLIYRTTALVFIECSGRNLAEPAAAKPESLNSGQESQAATSAA